MFESFDPAQWATPLFVGVGLVISQLFIYGKKVKRRVRISSAELVGDGMQFGVRMAITIASIRALAFVTGKPITEMWQVVSLTILICTSFDTYFLKIREIAMARVVGAARVLFDRLPEDAMMELEPSDAEDGGAMKVTTVKGIDKINERSATAGLPLRKAFVPKGSGHEDEQDEIDLLDKLK